MFWRVFSLRERGEKLPREAAFATARVGILIVKSPLKATLVDRAWNDVATLWDVELRQLGPSGDLLVRGMELRQDRRAVYEHRQIWFCEMLDRD